MAPGSTAPITRKRVRLHKGRRGGDSTPFAYMPVPVLLSDACRTAPHVAFRTAVALAAQYSGKNNGSLSLTRRTARDFGIVDTHALAASLLELEVRGLIIQTRPGTRLPPRSALYAICWRAIDPPHPSDPHDARDTLQPLDHWRSWQATQAGVHWNVQRRAARWGVPTSESGASPLKTPPMSGAGPLKEPVSPVGTRTLSHIWGQGGRRT